MARTLECPACFLRVPEDSTSCPFCHKKLSKLPNGTLIAEGMKPCFHCGKACKPDAEVCLHCGKYADGSDITLNHKPVGKKIDRVLWKTYLVFAILMIPSVFIGFGWFLAVFCLAVFTSIHLKTIRESTNLKQASDNIFMFSLVLILIGGFLTGDFTWILMDAIKARVDHSTQDQLLIMTGSILLSGLLGAAWASRQGIPNVWKFIKDLLMN